MLNTNEKIKLNSNLIFIQNHQFFLKYKLTTLTTSIVISRICNTLQKIIKQFTHFTIYSFIFLFTLSIVLIIEMKYTNNILTDLRHKFQKKKRKETIQYIIAKYNRKKKIQKR